MDNPEDSKPINPESVKASIPTPQANSTGIVQPPNPIPANSDWREVAAQAATETDPQKLSHLVDELIRLLDAERRSPKRSVE